MAPPEEAWARYLAAATASLPHAEQAREARDEMRAHLEGLRDDLVEAGWTDAEAAAEALRRMGDVRLVQRLWVDRVVDGRPVAAALVASALALQAGALRFHGLVYLSWVVAAPSLWLWSGGWPRARRALGAFGWRRALAALALILGAGMQVWADRHPLPVLPVSWALLGLGALLAVKRADLLALWDTAAKDVAEVFGWPPRWASPGTVGGIVGMVVGLSPVWTDLTVPVELFLAPATLAALAAVVLGPPWVVVRSEARRAAGIPRLAARIAAVRRLVLGSATGLGAAVALLALRPGLLSGSGLTDAAWTWSPCITYWSRTGYYWVGCRLKVQLMVLPAAHPLSFIVLTTLLPFWALYVLFAVALVQARVPWPRPGGGGVGAGA